MNGRQPLTGSSPRRSLSRSLLGSLRCSPSVFAGWVSYYTQCTIPMQVIVGITWGCKYPEFAARQSQPMKDCC